MTVRGDAADLPDVEQRAAAVALRQLLRRVESHGLPPPPPSADSLQAQVPLLSSKALREAVAKAHHVLNEAGLRGTLLGALDAEGRYWAYASALALEELAKREARVLADLADHPPAYLVASIGRPDPDFLDGASSSPWSWTTAASHIMSYRRQYAISDPTRALGADPTPSAALARETDWRFVMDEIRWSTGNLGEHLVDPRVLAVFDPTGRVDPPQALAALNDPNVRHQTIPEMRRRRIRAAPSHALRSEVTKTLGMLRSRPADRSAELERLNNSRDALEALYGRELALQVERARQAGAPLEGSQAREQLGRRLSELEAAITMMRQEQSQRQAWDKLNTQALAAGRLAADELASREHEALLALERDPPQHLVAELGRPPASGAGRQIWRHGARLIEQYRTRHDIDDPARPLGAAPEDPAQQTELTTVRHALDRITDSLQLTGTGQLALPPPPHELALDQ